MLFNYLATHLCTELFVVRREPSTTDSPLCQIDLEMERTAVSERFVDRFLCAIQFTTLDSLIKTMKLLEQHYQDLVNRRMSSFTSLDQVKEMRWPSMSVSCGIHRECWTEAALSVPLSRFWHLLSHADVFAFSKTRKAITNVFFCAESVFLTEYHKDRTWKVSQRKADIVQTVTFVRYPRRTPLVDASGSSMPLVFDRNASWVCNTNKDVTPGCKSELGV